MKRILHYIFHYILKLVGKEITDLGKEKLSMSFFSANNFFISSDILILKHALTAETVTALEGLELSLQKVTVRKKL